MTFLKPYFAFIDPVYFGMIQGLKATGNYAGANFIFLVILWPLIMYWLLVKVIVSQLKINQLKKKVMLEFVTDVVCTVFIYCTDFVINLSNLLNWSYYEVNTFLFCFLWPLVTVFLLIVYLRQRVRLRKYKSLKE